MPIQLNQEDGGKILVVHVSGKLTKAEYEQLVPEFERLVRQHGKLRLLFDMTGFHGWERPSPLGFHRAHLSLRDKTETQNKRTKICQINSQFCPKREHGRKRSLWIGDGFRPVSGVCLKGTYKPPTLLKVFPRSRCSLTMALY
jgi:hypothetical protein